MNTTSECYGYDIKYNPGYYEDYWLGNCLAVGLSSGFIEPLESTGIHIIIKQIYDFIFFNSNLKNPRPLNFCEQYITICLHNKNNSNIGNILFY